MLRKVAHYFGIFFIIFGYMLAGAEGSCRHVIMAVGIAWISITIGLLIIGGTFEKGEHPWTRR